MSIITEELKSIKTPELLALAEESKRLLEMRLRHRSQYKRKDWELQLLHLAYEALGVRKLDRQFGLDKKIP